MPRLRLARLGTRHSTAGKHTPSEGASAMTRDALIKLLGEGHAVCYYDDAALYTCDCGFNFGAYRQWVEHVTDLILLGFAT